MQLRLLLLSSFLLAALCRSGTAAAQAEQPTPETTPSPDPDPAPAPDPGPDPDAAAGAEAAEPEIDYPVFVPKARLIAGLELRKVHPTAEQVAEDNRQPYYLEQARIELEILLSDDLSGEFSAELSADPVIRDAYMNYKFKRWLQLTVGHFKRPISRTELISTGKLPFRDRGIFNRVMLRQREWGNRSLGAMLWGKIRSAGLEWYAAVTNSGPSMDVPELEQIRGVDALGRVEYTAPGKWLSIAVNGGYKLTEPYLGGPNIDLFAIGGDAQLLVGGFRLVLEAIAAQNPRPPAPPPPIGRTPWANVLMGWATYDIEPAPWITLQPVAVGEWVDTDDEVEGDEALRAVLGFNLLFFEHRLRVMPQVEVVRPLGTVEARSQVKRETYYLQLSMQY